MVISLSDSMSYRHKRTVLNLLSMVCLFSSVDIRSEDRALAITELEANGFNWGSAGLIDNAPDFADAVSVVDFGAVANDNLDDSSAFMAALDSKPANEGLIVDIPVGVFNLNSAIRVPSNRIVRGSGMKDTIIRLADTGKSFYTQPVQTEKWKFLTRAPHRGEYFVEIETTDGIKIGDFVEVVQENNPAEMYSKPEWNQTWAQDSVGQILLVSEVEDKKIYFEESFNITFDMNFKPKFRTLEMAKWIRFENFKIDGSLARTTTQKPSIYMKYVAFLSMTNIEGSWTNKAHFVGGSLYHCYIHGNYFHDSHSYLGNGHGYGVAIGRHTTGCLIENNHFDKLRHALLLATGANGNVVSYNYSTRPTWQWSGLPGDISMHGHYSFSNLIEGNVIQKLAISDYWGRVGPGNLYFRNCVQKAGIQFGEYTPGQWIVGNKLLSKGIISMPNSGFDQSNKIVKHGNEIDNLIQYNPTISEESMSVESYYLDEKPSFLRGQKWPPIDVNAVGCVLPAQKIGLGDNGESKTP